MTPLLSGVATCVVALSEVAVEPTETGWTESAEVTIDAKGPCPWVDLILPPGPR